VVFEDRRSRVNWQFPASGAPSCSGSRPCPLTWGFAEAVVVDEAAEDRPTNDPTVIQGAGLTHRVLLADEPDDAPVRFEIYESRRPAVPHCWSPRFTGPEASREIHRVHGPTSAGLPVAVVASE
jgi:hypothetical protein